MILIWRKVKVHFLVRDKRQDGLIWRIDDVVCWRGPRFLDSMAGDFGGPFSGWFRWTNNLVILVVILGLLSNGACLLAYRRFFNQAPILTNLLHIISVSMTTIRYSTINCTSWFLFLLVWRETRRFLFSLQTLTSADPVQQWSLMAQWQSWCGKCNCAVWRWLNQCLNRVLNETNQAAFFM